MTTDAKFQEGLEHFRNANYMAAIDLWQSLRESGYAHPNLEELLRSARLERAKVLQHAEALSAALDRLADGDDVNDGLRKAAVRAREAVRARRYDDAGDELAAVAVAGKTPAGPGVVGAATLTLAMARIRSMQGRARDALDLAETARAQSPNDAECLAVLGNILVDLDRAAEAEKAFLAAIELERMHHRAWCGLAAVYYGQQRLPLAVECLRKALAGRPGDLAALSFLDEVRQELDSARDSLEEARKMVAQHPGFPDWQFRLGKLLALQGETREAFECYGRALDANPRYARCWHERAGLHLREERWAEALADLKKALELVGLHDEEALARSRALEAEGHVAEAATECWEALRAEPDLASRHIEVGKLFFREGLYEQAARELLRGISIKPHYPDGHHFLGLVHLQARHFDQALACFEAALQAKPSYARAAVAVVETHLAAGKLEEARAALERARGLVRGDQEKRRLEELVSKLEVR